MDFSEEVLYQQIHPAKLLADVSGSLLSTYLMWRRRFAWAMLAAFVPAAVASVLVIAYADLERRKESRSVAFYPPRSTLARPAGIFQTVS